MRISTVFAHADDAELWAGGTLLKHSVRGDTVNILTFADPESGRRAEAEAGARLLGAECRVDNRNLFESGQLSAAISRFLNSTLPDILITHWDRDTHPEHVAVFQAVLASTVYTRIERGIPSILLASDTYGSVGIDRPFSPSLYVDVTEVFDAKLSAIRAHQSQPFDHWVEMASTLGRLHGFRSGCRYAEAFLEIPILGQTYHHAFLPTPVPQTSEEVTGELS